MQQDLDEIGKKDDAEYTWALVVIAIPSLLGRIGINLYKVRLRAELPAATKQAFTESLPSVFILEKILYISSMLGMYQSPSSSPGTLAVEWAFCPAA